MFAKTIALLAFVAATQAIHSGGVYDNTLALGTQSESTFRGFGGLSSVSKQAKAIDSAYASVRKYDSRVTNDAALVARPVGYAGYAGGYAAPALAHGYAAPALAHGYAAPAVAYGHGPAIAHGYAGQALAHGYAAPALAHGYAAPALAHGYAAPALAHGYASPALAHGYAAPVGVAKAVHGLGVAYSPAAAVATHSFNGFGISYGY